MSGTDGIEIAADTKLNDILERYSSAGPILVQAGRGWVNKRGDLYAQFPDLTVAQYAELNGLEVGRVLRLLQAAAEAEERTKKSATSRGDQDDVWRRPPVTIGYTSSYDEREGMSPGATSVVHVQSERGPV
jgi:hypothetical protein